MEGNIFLTTEEVSKILNVDILTLWRWNKTGKLPYIVIGGFVRYDSTLIDSFLKGRGCSCGCNCGKCRNNKKGGEK